MTSDKRSFDNFEEFPGEIIENIYVFPRLQMKDSRDRIRHYDVFVRLIKDGNRQSTIDFDLLAEKQLPIKSVYLTNSVPNDIIAQIYVEQGISGGKITRSIPTYVVCGKNLGKTNERNVLQQALIDARSLYLKKLNAGATENDTVVHCDMMFPMLAKSFVDGEKHIVYPAYIQPKLNGIRCVAYLSKVDSDYTHVVLYTRTTKIIPSVNYLKKDLYETLNALYNRKTKESIYLDGELYKHGKLLQDISGDSRNSTVSNNLNEYHLYDCFYPSKLHMNFEKRNLQLQEVFVNDLKYVKYVHTKLINSFDEAVIQYNKYLKKSYEGAMLRNMKGSYLAACKTGSFMRSNNLVKMKPKYTDEFECVGFTSGTRGKDVGAIIYECVTDKNVAFTVTPKDMTYEQRYSLYKEAKKNFSSYLHRMLTVEYDELSKAGVPLRAKAVVFRDYE